MKTLVAYIFIICLSIGFIACQKEPQKGDYKGTFTGDYPDGSHYMTTYDFTITHSNKKELRLEEKQSGTTSILKKYSNDSISGMIGFAGKIYNPDKKENVTFMTIKIEGKYKSNTISGVFSTTFTNEDDNKQYNSTGDFSIVPF